MEKLFLFEISLFIITSLDARLNIPMLPISHMIIFILIFILLTIQLVVVVGCGSRIIHLPKTFGIYVAILISYTIGSLGKYADEKEIVMSFLFITVIFECGLYISRYECIEKFCECAYFSSFLFFMSVIVFKKIDMIEVIKNINIYNYFSTNYFRRSRYAFEFYNPNAVGNVCACLLSLFFFLWKSTQTKREQGEKNNLKNICLVAATFLYIVIFLASGSRTAAIALIIFILLNMFFSIKSETNRRISICMQMIAVFLTGVLVAMEGYEFYINHYLGSGRYKSISNLAMISGVKNNLFGIGLFSPGGIKNISINGTTGSTLDNFYIFCYLSMGIVGAVIILGSLVALLIYTMRIKDKVYGKMFLCLYIELLIYGLSETSVLYYMFISDLIIMSMIFGWCNKEYKTKVADNT